MYSKIEVLIQTYIASITFIVYVHATICTNCVIQFTSTETMHIRRYPIYIYIYICKIMHNQNFFFFRMFVYTQEQNIYLQHDHVHRNVYS